MADAIVAGLLGALIGSLPFAWALARLAGGVDLREAGSGSAGATNVYRTVGPASAAAALVLDAMKGVVAVTLGRALIADDGWTSGAAALGAVVGHAWPPWLRFRGGRGVAPGAGALAVLAPWALAGALAVFVAVLVLARWVSLASIAAAATFPVIAVLRGEPRSTILTGVAVAAVITWRHRDNVRRLRQGREPKLGDRGSSR